MVRREHHDSVHEETKRHRRINGMRGINMISSLICQVHVEVASTTFGEGVSERDELANHVVRTSSVSEVKVQSCRVHVRVAPKVHQSVPSGAYLANEEGDRLQSAGMREVYIRCVSLIIGVICPGISIL